MFMSSDSGSDPEGREGLFYVKWCGWVSMQVSYSVLAESI